MFNVDSHFVKGSTHTICQDYTSHGFIGDVPYIILADGCSDAHRSEFGAQLLIRACELAISNYLSLASLSGFEPENIKSTIETFITIKLDTILSNMELNTSIACATLMFAFVYNRRLYVYSRGDGTLSIKYTLSDGTIKSFTKRFGYDSNAPYYIVYELSEMDKQLYASKYDANFNITSYNDSMQIESTEIKKYDYSTFDVIDVSDAIINHVVLSSDGLESYKKHRKSTDAAFDLAKAQYERNVARAIDFKNKYGVFVVRRLQRMEADDVNIVEHTDDVSIAALVEVEVPNVKS